MIFLRLHGARSGREFWVRGDTIVQLERVHRRRLFGPPREYTTVLVDCGQDLDVAEDADWILHTIRASITVPAE